MSKGFERCLRRTRPTGTNLSFGCERAHAPIAVVVTIVPVAPPRLALRCALSEFRGVTLSCQAWRWSVVPDSFLRVEVCRRWARNYPWAISRANCGHPAANLFLTVTRFSYCYAFPERDRGAAQTIFQRGPTPSVLPCQLKARGPAGCARDAGGGPKAARGSMYVASRARRSNMAVGGACAWACAASLAGARHGSP